MKRSSLWMKENNIELPFPNSDIWNNQQLKINFALSHLVANLPIHIRSYISYYYGDFSYVINFAKFYSDFWEQVGRDLKKIDFFDLIDIKFVEWLKIMQFDELFKDMDISFNEVFEINKFCMY